jgi:hypothetical protein
MATFSHNSISLRYNACMKRAVVTSALHIGFCYVPFVFFMWVWVTTFIPTCQCHQALHTSTLKMEAAHVSIPLKPDHNVTSCETSTTVLTHHCNSQGCCTHWQEHRVNVVKSLCGLLCLQWETWLLHFFVCLVSCLWTVQFSKDTRFIMAYRVFHVGPWFCSIM